MSIELQISTSVLSNISQIVATIISIYLVVLIFVLGRFTDKQKDKKPYNKKIRNLVAFLPVILLVISYFFLFPSTELGIWSYIAIFFMLIYMVFNYLILLRTKKWTTLEKGIMVFTCLFALVSFILGFYIIINSLSLMAYAQYLNENTFFLMIKLTRLFLILMLISFAYLISFLLVHKLFISRE